MTNMGFTDTVKNTTLSVSGRAKEIAGFTFKNEDLQYEGKADQITANLRKARARGMGAVDSLRKAVGI
ncbi:MAG TPA: CsbD family protein [Actinobacteria bacterium]|jgi:uncharacterized protein YjbJ (UPF0337 family)|nr:CsbD family protein [Actinomycetota bacterium]